MRAALVLLACCAWAADWRNITSGSEIPNEGYADQPYIVKTDDGAWLCVITTGKGLEGEGGQHVVTMRSTDQGKTWSKPVDVEPANGPEASYAVLLKAPYGRVYVFYNHNTDNVRQAIADNPPYKTGFVTRVDSLGHFVFKYSDDGGRSWSAKRYEVPMRDFEIDKKNPYGGKLKFFWTVGKAFTLKGAGYVPVHKVGGFGEGFFTSSEGVLLRSGNILTERDAAKITWETLPEGEKGIRTPEGGGTVAEEQSFSVMSDGSIFCVFRTIDGYSAYTYSRDGGRTWEPSQYMRYADGRLMKHPRAANFAWRCDSGKYLYWFHNHGGRFIREHPRQRTIAYEDRNPVWLVGGVEADSPRGKIIRWSQPEIALYDDDPIIRMSYPDLVEDGGKYFLTETQKDVGRVHEIDRSLLEGLWAQFDSRGVPKDGLVVDTRGGQTVDAPPFPTFVVRAKRMDHGSEHTRAGFTIELWGRFSAGQTLVDNRTADGKGMRVYVTGDRALEIILGDGRTENRWASDPGSVDGTRLQHAAITVDGGPNIITYVIDGKLNDGGEARQFGWGRFHPNLQNVNGARQLAVGKPVERLRIYNRALRTSESIGSFRAGLASEIAKDLGVVYAVTTADVNGDRKPDIVAINNTQVLWFENPSWTKHVIAERITKNDNVALAPYDVDSDGRMDFALGADWQPTNTTSGGTVHWISSDGKVRDIATEPTVHRMRWIDVDADGRQELVVVPLHGRGTKAPDWKGAGARILVYKIPRDAAKGTWPVEVADESLHIVHNFIGSGKEIWTASAEGVHALTRNADGKWSRRLIAEGAPGEIKLGTAGSRRWLATVEPWHGNSIVVYEEGSTPWKRTVVESALNQAHALAWADTDGDGNDELIAGWRGKPWGIALFRLQDGKWMKTDLDDGVAVEDLAAADLDGDGRPEIIAGGRATGNLRIYHGVK